MPGSIDMYPEPLQKMIDEDMKKAQAMLLQQINQYQFPPGLMQKGLQDAVLMEEQRRKHLQVLQEQQRQRVYEVALDEVMGDIIEGDPVLAQFESVIRHTAAGFNPSTIQQAKQALKDAAKKMREALDKAGKEPPKETYRMLFVGGPYDGQWRAVERGKKEVTVMERVAIGPVNGPAPRLDVPLKTKTYKLVGTDETPTQVFLFEDIPATDLFDHLVAGYKGAMENKYGVD